jgi:hypothetical protein
MLTHLLTSSLERLQSVVYQESYGIVCSSTVRSFKFIIKVGYGL